MLEKQVLVGGRDRFDLIGGDASRAEFVADMFLELGDPQAHLHFAGEVAAVDRPDDHRRALFVEGFAVVARVAQRLVGGVEQHELQRIGVRHLLRRNFVLLPVVHKVGDEAPQGVRDAARTFRLRRVIQFLRPAVGGDLTLRIAARREQVPKGLQG